jgi:hypothetical protein
MGNQYHMIIVQQETQDPLRINFNINSHFLNKSNHSILKFNKYLNNLLFTHKNLPNNNLYRKSTLSFNKINNLNTE